MGPVQEGPRQTLKTPVAALPSTAPRSRGTTWPLTSPPAATARPVRLPRGRPGTPISATEETRDL